MKTTPQTVVYTQLNKDSAYWPEKIASGDPGPSGHTAGLFRVLDQNNRITQQLLVDAGLGTIQALCDPRVGFDWGAPLEVLITHGHPDHHLELMILSEVYCQRLAAPKPKPLTVRCTLDTFEKWLRPNHTFRFEPRTSTQTLHFAEIRPLRSGFLASPVGARIGPFTVEAIENDHFPGAANFVVQFGANRVLIAWDLRSLPSPDLFPVLRGASLALVEANTVLATPKSGHASAQELCESGFLRKLEVQGKGIFLVHSGGRVDEDDPRCLTDAQFLQEIKTRWPEALRDLPIGIAQARQSWDFPLSCSPSPSS